MPIELKKLDDGVGIRYVFTGLVTGKELIGLNAALYASGKQLQKIKYAIVDESQMESLDLTFVELKKIEEMDKQAALLNPHIVVALVVGKDLHLHITRAWEVRTNDLTWEKKIFGSNDEANDWVRKKVRDKFGEEVTLNT